METAGVRVGALRLFPKAAVTLVHDSNVFASNLARDAAVLTISEAQLHVRNDPGVFALSGEGFVRDRQYTQLHDQDTTEYGATAAATSSIDARNELTARVAAQRRFESRIEIETPEGRDVSLYDEWRGEIGYLHAFNRLALRSTVLARRLEYQEDGQGFRDRSFYRGELRAAYDYRDGVSLVATGLYAEDDYRLSSPLVASARTGSALLGVHIDIPEILDVDLSGGYFRRATAQQPDDMSGLSIRAGVSWNPTRLTTVRARVLREDAPTRIVGAYGKLRTNGEIGVDHAYSSAIDLHLRARWIRDDFDVIRRTDDSFLTELGATWSLSRQVAIVTRYDYAGRHAGFAGNDFDRHLLSVSLHGYL